MGTARHLIYRFEEVAKKEGVRVLIVDRYVFLFYTSEMFWKWTARREIGKRKVAGRQDRGVDANEQDRPGFGGSTAVPLDKRANTWLESVPAVLEKLEVEHVALMSHSAGTFYAFNTAVMLPHLLYPGRGFMACLGMLLFLPFLLNLSHPKMNSY
jgi:pimeloyl-ACP methyl ester carboxylesterase